MFKPEDARNKLVRPDQEAAKQARYRCRKCGATGPVDDFDPHAVPPDGAYRIVGCACPGGRTNFIVRAYDGPDPPPPEGTPPE